MVTLHPLPDLLVEPIVRTALLDDLGRAGDITTNRIVPADLTASGTLSVRRPGRIAGLACARIAFHLMDAGMDFNPMVADGDAVLPGEAIATITGNARAMLTAERSALNLLCHLSGIATETARLAALIPRNMPARLVGTRKTTPGLRALEKYAVNCGGGLSHRYGLDDAVLIKDNHVALAGSVREAIRRVRQDLGQRNLAIRGSPSRAASCTGRTPAACAQRCGPHSLVALVMQRVSLSQNLSSATLGPRVHVIGHLPSDNRCIVLQRGDAFLQNTGTACKWLCCVSLNGTCHLVQFLPVQPASQPAVLHHCADAGPAERHRGLRDQRPGARLGGAHSRQRLPPVPPRQRAHQLPPVREPAGGNDPHLHLGGGEHSHTATPCFTCSPSAARSVNCSKSPHTWDALAAL